MVHRLIFTILLLCTITMYAQDTKVYNKGESIPLDKTVLTGKLDNGLTYFIKENTKPSDKAQLRLVVKAGSLQEEEDQQGLAHFVEHMAFNGTKNFEKNSLIDYLEKLGVQFGADLNAHTAFHETVYKLSVPTNNEELFDQSFLILRDWADGIVFDKKEVDAERGIILAEQRERNSVARRLYFNSLPELSNHSRYSKRFPGGKKEIIENFKYKELERYYKDWYRPDLMGVIVVGDFNAEDVEWKIKSHFSSMKLPKKAYGKLNYEIPEQSEMKVIKLRDKEATEVNFALYYKNKAKELKNHEDFRKHIIEKLYWIMLKDRLAEKELELNTPFLSTKAGIGTFLGDTDNYFIKATLKDDMINKGITAALEENFRVKQHGFTMSELERAKLYLLNYMKFVASEEDKIPSKHYVDEFTKYFSTGKIAPGKVYTYEFYNDVLPGINLEEVNSIAHEWIKEKNMVLVLTGSEKAEFPADAWLKQEVSKTASSKLDAYHDSLADKKIMEGKPLPGKIIETNYISKIGTTIWTLSNGVKVIARPSTLQNGIVEMSGFREGGSSVVDDRMFLSAVHAGDIIGRSGFNNISDMDIEKLNMGKVVSVTPRINYYDDLMSGECTNPNMETMLQMVYMYMTKPNKDEAVFQRAKSKLLLSDKRRKNNANSIYYDRISKIMTQGHLRGGGVDSEKINSALSLDEAFEFYKHRFSSASGFTFIFTGNFELNTLKDLVTDYLASLPVNKDVYVGWKDIGLRRVKGRVKEVVYAGEEEKSTVNLRYTGELDFSLEEQYKLSTLGKVLKLKLTEELREKMSGVYGVKASGFSTYVPYEWYRMNVEFSCHPDDVEPLIEATNRIIETIKRDGIGESELAKIKKADLANHRDGLKYDAYWTYKMRDLYKNKLPLEEILNIPDLVNSVTKEELKELANRYFDNSNYAEFILLPESYKEK